MDTNEIINILENENLTLKFRKTESIPMGHSIHFSFSCSKEELSKEMIKRFGRDFNKYDGNEALFINTNGVNLEKINTQNMKNVLTIEEIEKLLEEDAKELPTKEINIEKFDVIRNMKKK